MKLLVSQTLAIALSQNGVREINHSNTGPEVDQYLAAAGNPPGEPWCASFGVWCIREACKLLGQPYPAIKSGYCPDWHNWAVSCGVLHTTPQPGDIGLVLESNGYHHFFFVVECLPYGADKQGRLVIPPSVKTVEGNTNDDGSAEGDGVYIRRRTLSSRYAYVRWADVLPDDVSYTLHLDGKPVLDGHKSPVQLPALKGIAMCPVRPWAQALGFPIGFHAPNTVTVAGSSFPSALMLTDPTTGVQTAHVAIRTLARAAGLQVDGDVNTRIINVHR